jgi:polyphosphate glucokinase
VSSPALGIDIGGSGIKAGFVNLETGQLIGERIKIDTPQPSTPDAVAATLKELIDSLDWKGEKIGVGFPSTMHDGVSLIAANIDKGWINMNVVELFHRYTGHEYHIINDADAAGLAERMFGKIRDVRGTVVMLTIGTGIGSALFYDGVLIPNSEFGHLFFKGKIAEHWVSNRARKERELTYDQWATELAEFLDHIIFILSPRLIILGGGISFRWNEFAHHFSHLRVPVDCASAYNDAGIIGAAVAAYPELIQKYR